MKDYELYTTIILLEKFEKERTKYGRDSIDKYMKNCIETIITEIKEEILLNNRDEGL